MTNPLILTDWACVPPCKKCKDAGICETASTIVPPPPPLDGPFLPGDLDSIPIQCGCSVSWPVISLLGSRGQQIWCDQHGYQRVTKQTITKTQQRMKKALKNATTGQLEIDDIPPF